MASLSDYKYGKFTDSRDYYRPREQYIVYLDEKSKLYNTYHMACVEDYGGGEGVVVGYMGYSKTHLPDDKRNGLNKTFHFKDAVNKILYVSSGHQDYAKSIIKKSATTYLKSKKDVWFLWHVAGWTNFVDAVEKSGGALVNSTVELMFSKTKTQYYTFETELFDVKCKALGTGKPDKNVIEQMTALDALRRYGVYSMEEANEKTMSIVDS